MPDAKPDSPPATVLPAGTLAPDFTLAVTEEQSLTLSDLRGHPVILAFYPADWSPVCGDQLGLYNTLLPEFQRYNARLLGISVDGIYCHAAYAAHRGFSFTLLADFEPKGAVARRYGAYEPFEGLAERALFVLDGKGVIRWSCLAAMDSHPGADGILKALEQIAQDETQG